MSMQADLSEFLTTLAHGATGEEVLITPEQMALQTGITRDKVNKTLNNLMTRKRIELLRGPNGRSITGYRLLEPPGDKRRRVDGADGEAKPAPRSADKPAPQPAAEPEPEVREKRSYRRRYVFTPLLDNYQHQKQRFERLTSELGDRIEATFREDPMAEEALALKERLEVAEEQAADWRHKAEGWEHEARALRTRHMQAVERKAVEAGAMVQHSSD